MTHRIRRTAALVALIAPLATLAFTSPVSADDGGDRDEATIVYTQTNAAAGNSVLALSTAGGTLSNIGTYSTGALGAGTGLGSQGAVASDDDHLVAVNAGSNSVSLFSISDNGGLRLRDVETSAGVRPVSVAIHDDLVYVVNVTSQNVTGYKISRNQLVPIAGSTQSLPGNGAGQISFDAQGKNLIVTEKATNTIDVLPLRRGVAGAAVSNPTGGVTPFGFAVDRRNNVIVSFAFGGGVQASAVSSFSLKSTSLTAVSSNVPTTQTAACWIALSTNQKFAYAANAGSASISSYSVARNGSLALVNAQAAQTGATALDLASSNNVLYSLAGGAHTVTAYSIGSDGSLTFMSQIAVPTGVAGLSTN